jgi:hypothetical protein
MNQPRVCQNIQPSTEIHSHHKPRFLLQERLDVRLSTSFCGTGNLPLGRSASRNAVVKPRSESICTSPRSPRSLAENPSVIYLIRLSPIDSLIGSNQIIRAESILPILLCIPNAHLNPVAADGLAVLLLHATLATLALRELRARPRKPDGLSLASSSLFDRIGSGSPSATVCRCI